jgi:hypothetical protein
VALRTQALPADVAQSGPKDAPLTAPASHPLHEARTRILAVAAMVMLLLVGFAFLVSRPPASRDDAPPRPALVFDAASTEPLAAPKPPPEPEAESKVRPDAGARAVPPDAGLRLAPKPPPAIEM